MKSTIYVEGGGNNNQDTRARCRQGFSEYCNKLATLGHRPQIVVCGSRSETFKRFSTAATHLSPGDKCALLVDAEAPIRPGLSPAAHLASQENWGFSGLPSDQVFLMVQAMEAWFLADPQALANYYGNNFRPNALPGNARNIEAIQKSDLEPALKAATAATTKGPYRKATHGFDLLAAIDPSKTEASSPRAAALHQFLRSL